MRVGLSTGATGRDVERLRRILVTEVAGILAARATLTTSSTAPATCAWGSRPQPAARRQLARTRRRRAVSAPDRPHWWFSGPADRSPAGGERDGAGARGQDAAAGTDQGASDRLRADASSAGGTAAAAGSPPRCRRSRCPRAAARSEGSTRS